MEPAVAYCIDLVSQLPCAPHPTHPFLCFTDLRCVFTAPCPAESPSPARLLVDAGRNTLSAYSLFKILYCPLVFSLFSLPCSQVIPYCIVIASCIKRQLLNGSATAWEVRSLTKLVYMFSLHHWSEFLVFLLS